jgi:hypothetical protein
MEPSEYHWFTHPTAVHLVPAVYTVLCYVLRGVCVKKRARERCLGQLRVSACTLHFFLRVPKALVIQGLASWQLAHASYTLCSLKQAS